LSSRPDSTSLTGPDGTIERVNSSWQRDLGYPAQELEGRKFETLIHPDDLAATQEEMEKLSQGHAVKRFKNRYRHKDGSWRTLLWWSSMLHDDGKVYAIAHDVTDIQETQERLELALQGAELGTWDWNIPSGDVVFNARWAEMLGYRLDEIEPNISSWEKLIHPDDLPHVRPLLEAHLSGSTDAYRAEHRLRHKSGEWVWVLDCGKVIQRDTSGKPLRACGIHQDITEQKTFQTQLEEKMHQLERFNKAAVGRELRMVELKREVNRLCRELGRKEPYQQPL
jgi:PAS domain S-box-containing protein